MDAIVADRGQGERSACLAVAETRRPPCEVCGAPMEPEHAHHTCPECGYILPCCGW